MTDYQHLIGRKTAALIVDSFDDREITGVIAAIDEVREDHLIVRFESGYRARLIKALAEAARPAESAKPTFDDYDNARVHAWATGSVGATYNATEYRKEWDDHRIDECSKSPYRAIEPPGDGEECLRCRRVFTRVYGDPPVGHPVDRVARFLAYYDDRPTNMPIHTVAGASTGHKDVALMVSDLRYLVDFHAARRGRLALGGLVTSPKES